MRATDMIIGQVHEGFVRVADYWSATRSTPLLDEEAKSFLQKWQAVANEDKGNCTAPSASELIASSSSSSSSSESEGEAEAADSESEGEAEAADSESEGEAEAETSEGESEGTCVFRPCVLLLFSLILCPFFSHTSFTLIYRMTTATLQLTILYFVRYT
jgi:hypothetical protein